jgi:MFS family permease
MIAENIKEKKYQSRAFLILPMAFNVAALFGPLLGGLLADPAKVYPGVFGEKALFGFSWMKTYPYALANIIPALLLLATAAAVYLGLREVNASFFA